MKKPRPGSSGARFRPSEAGFCGLSTARKYRSGGITMKVQRDGRDFTVDVTADGEGVVSHAGAALLAGTSDRDRADATRSRRGLAPMRERRGGSRPRSGGARPRGDARLRRRASLRPARGARPGTALRSGRLRRDRLAHRGGDRPRRRAARARFAAPAEGRARAHGRQARSPRGRCSSTSIRR